MSRTSHPLMAPPGLPIAARRQGGVFTAAQARAEGWSDRTIRRRIVAHRWIYVAGRALAEPRDRWTAFQLAMAAHLSLAGAVISHRTAANLNGFPGFDDCEQVCDVILTTNRRAGRAIRAHWLRLVSNDVATHSAGFRITSPQRTAVDCLATMPTTTAALDLWAWVSSRRILDQEKLCEAIATRRNWYGTSQLKRIAALVADGGVSGAEFLFHDLLKRAGLREWSANVPISDSIGLIGVVDVLFPAQRVIIEIDGFRAHSNRANFVADRQRQNRLVAAGYTPLRYTWDDLTQRPTQVITEIREMLATRSGRRA